MNPTLPEYLEDEEDEIIIPETISTESTQSSDSDKTVEKILSFENLPEGWHYGEGGPIDRTTINKALEINLFFIFNGLSHTDAFAGADKEILVTAYNDDHYVGVILEPDGRMSFRHEIDRKEKLYFETCKIEEIKQAISKMTRDAWNIFDSFTPNISTTPLEDLTIYLLNRIKRTKHYL